MKRVLLVDESEDFHLFVKNALSGPDIGVERSRNVSEAIHVIDQCRERPFDLAIFDMVLPDGDALKLMQEMRQREWTREVPVMILSGRDDLESKVTAFDLGVEDYLVKPVHSLELQARLNMRIRKLQERREHGDTLRRGPLLFRASRMSVTVVETGAGIDLTAKEFKILYFLAKSEGQVFSRGDIVKEVWGRGVHVLDRTIDSHICSIRKKLGRLSPVIESLPNAGYRFSALRS